MPPLDPTNLKKETFDRLVQYCGDVVLETVFSQCTDEQIASLTAARQRGEPEFLEALTKVCSEIPHLYQTITQNISAKLESLENLANKVV